nr:immunoglobulin heavy chain junction region [Mus musculus]
CARGDDGYYLPYW